MVPSDPSHMAWIGSLGDRFWFLAYDGCSQEAQGVITEMVNILIDESIPADEKSHAADVIAEAMFPSLTTDIRESDECRNASDEAKAEEAVLISEENAFSDRLRALMAEKGISQEKLAAEASGRQTVAVEIRGVEARGIGNHLAK